MKHWKEFPKDAGHLISVSFSCKHRLWYWIDQTRGKKSRSQFIREILTEAMENA